MEWYEKLINRPWAGRPRPPYSFNCGELIRYIYRKRLGIEMPAVWADGNSLRQSIVNMNQPQVYGFHPCEPPYRPFDICIMKRSVRRDHVALIVQTSVGLLFLHCIQGAGVVLENEFEIKATTGNDFMEYQRHNLVTQEMALCHA